MRIADAAVAVLRETGNPAVMWGDTVLLDMIAQRAGMGAGAHPLRRHRRVLAALGRHPELFEKRYTRFARVVRRFVLVAAARPEEPGTPE